MGFHVSVSVSISKVKSSLPSYSVISTHSVDDLNSAFTLDNSLSVRLWLLAVRWNVTVRVAWGLRASLSTSRRQCRSLLTYVRTWPHCGCWQADWLLVIESLTAFSSDKPTTVHNAIHWLPAGLPVMTFLWRTVCVYVLWTGQLQVVPGRGWGGGAPLVGGLSTHAGHHRVFAPCSKQVCGTYYCVVGPCWRRVSHSYIQKSHVSLPVTP